MKLSNSAISVIDALQGFTTRGSFGKAYGKEDVRPIDETFERIRGFLGDHPDSFPARSVVRSIYEPGQFTLGQESPLYDLCTKGGRDVMDAIPYFGDWQAITKRTNAATDVPAYLDWLGSAVRARVENIVIAGATLTSCLKQTSIGSKRFLDREFGKGVNVVVPLDLAGVRASVKNSPDYSRAIEEMRDCMVTVIENGQTH